MDIKAELRELRPLRSDPDELIRRVLLLTTGLEEKLESPNLLTTEELAAVMESYFRDWFVGKLCSKLEAWSMDETERASDYGLVSMVEGMGGADFPRLTSLCLQGLLRRSMYVAIGDHIDLFSNLLLPAECLRGPIVFRILNKLHKRGCRFGTLPEKAAAESLKATTNVSELLEALLFSEFYPRGEYGDPLDGAELCLGRGLSALENRASRDAVRKGDVEILLECCRRLVEIHMERMLRIVLLARHFGLCDSLAEWLPLSSPIGRELDFRDQALRLLLGYFPPEDLDAAFRVDARKMIQSHYCMHSAVRIRASLEHMPTAWNPAAMIACCDLFGLYRFDACGGAPSSRHALFGPVRLGKKSFMAGLAISVIGLALMALPSQALVHEGFITNNPREMFRGSPDRAALRIPRLQALPRDVVGLLACYVCNHVDGAAVARTVWRMAERGRAAEEQAC
jgi:hypothetical protein